MLSDHLTSERDGRDEDECRLEEEEKTPLVERECTVELSSPDEIAEADGEKKETPARQQVAQLSEHPEVKRPRVAKARHEEEESHEAQSAHTRGQ